MKSKTNKKRGDRYMGRGHSRSKSGSKGGCGRAGYKKHKKTLKIFESRLKCYKKKSYLKAEDLIASDRIKQLMVKKPDKIIITTKYKILNKKLIIKKYGLKLPVKFNVLN